MRPNGSTFRYGRERAYLIEYTFQTLRANGILRKAALDWIAEAIERHPQYVEQLRAECVPEDKRSILAAFADWRPDSLAKTGRLETSIEMLRVTLTELERNSRMAGAMERNWPMKKINKTFYR